MQKIFLSLMLCYSFSCFATETFWPPDMVPHPHPPQPTQDDNMAFRNNCGRCGWPKDASGKCTNSNCEGYGPRERYL